MLPGWVEVKAKSTLIAPGGSVIALKDQLLLSRRRKMHHRALHNDLSLRPHPPEDWRGIRYYCPGKVRSIQTRPVKHDDLYLLHGVMGSLMCVESSA